MQLIRIWVQTKILYDKILRNLQEESFWIKNRLPKPLQTTCRLFKQKTSLACRDPEPDSQPSQLNQDPIRIRNPKYWIQKYPVPTNLAPLKVSTLFDKSTVTTILSARFIKNILFYISVMKQITCLFSLHFTSNNLIDCG
jgi:hypothetical protein